MTDLTDDNLIALLYALWVYRQQHSMRSATLVRRIINRLLPDDMQETEDAEIEGMVEEEIDKRKLQYLK